MEAEQHRTAKERTLFVIAAIISGICWLAVAISIVGLIYAPLIALFVVIAHALFLAYITGNGVRLGTRQLPDLYKRVEHAAQRLGIQQMPEVYLVESHGVLNAFATKLLSRRFVILNSAIVDACMEVDGEDLNNLEQPHCIDFIIGHELAHHALGHLSWNWFLLPSMIVPLLGPAYSRACEYSCDACGFMVNRDFEAGARALTILAAGNQARRVSVEAFMEQRHDTGSFFMAVYELNISHPYLPKRVAALKELAMPGRAPAPSRNPLSYLFAPAFTFAVGGTAAAGMWVVMYVGIIAAIAIPSFMQYQADAERKAAGPAAILAALKAAESNAPVLEQFEDVQPTTDDSATKVKKLSIQRGDGYVYWLDENLNVVRMRIGGDAEEIVQTTGLKRERGYLYYLDADGDIARTALDLEGAPDEDSDEAPSFEARPWLAANKNKQPIASERFKTRAAAKAFIDLLYKNGAVAVKVTDVDDSDETIEGEGGPYASTLVVDLPSQAGRRKKLFAMCAAEAARYSDYDCTNEPDVTQLTFNWE